MVLLLSVFACGTPEDDPAGEGDSGHKPSHLPDESAPEVRFLSPAAGSTLTGTVAVEADATDNVGVTALTLRIDEVRVVELAEAPWTAAWDTTLGADGPHRLSWTARDHAGNLTEARRNVTVQNGTLPLDSIAVVSPKDDSTVCGSVPIEAWLSADLVSATLFLGGEERATRTAPPYRWTWDTEGRAEGDVDVAVVGTSADGARVVDRVSVHVSAADPCDEPPVIRFTEPDWNEEVAGDAVPVELEVSDDAGAPAEVNLTVDGTALTTLTAAPWTTTWDSTTLPEGSHDLRATAIDTAGTRTTTWTRVQTDVSTPRARILTPADAADVQGVVNVTADVTDAHGLAGAELFVDGVSQGVLATAPFAWGWDTVGSYGSVELRVTAFDSAGHTASDSIDVTVDNPPDLDFYRPADGDVLAGDTPWAATAADDDAVDRVELLLDGVEVTTDSTYPYRGTLETCAIPSGAHTLTAVATDSAAQATEATVNVVVDQDTFADHRSVGQLHASTTFLAEVADDDPIVSVEWTLDGVSIGTAVAGTADPGACVADCDDLCVRYSLAYDASAVAEGSHTLVVTATNSSGTTASDTTTVTLDHDADDDGHEAIEWGGADCDDDDDTVFPGATETCDGVDQDCDGDADEDFDLDGDGFYERDACPAGDDCDDADPDVNPDATEVCDGVDNDCDDTIDVSGPPTEATGDFSAGTLAASFTDQAWGNVYVPTRDVTLHHFTTTLDPGTLATTFAVWSAPTAAGPFTLVDDQRLVVTGVEGDYVSPTFDVPLSAGTTYLLTVGSDDTILVRYARRPALTEDGALTPGGLVKETSGGSPSSISSAADSTLLLAQTVAVSWVEADDLDADGDGQNAYCGDCDDEDAAVGLDFAEVCDGLDDDCDGVVPATEVDADGDGAPLCAPDCDDTDATRSPGAIERCDGVDNDCDGIVAADEADADGDGVAACQTCVGSTCTMDCADDDPAVLVATTYADADGDGYGDDSTAVTTCPTAAGVAVGGDCDDSDTTRSPARTETCNSVDDDCDGVVDEGYDADGDGIGACDDCDDTDASVLPGAPEVCGDSVDDDCDGLANECRFEGESVVSGADLLLWGEATQDMLWQVQAGDFDADGEPDVAFSTPYVDAAGASAGALYVLDGPISTDGPVGAQLRLLGDSAGDALGLALTSGYDLDGDGVADLLVGADGDDDNGPAAGAAYVLPRVGAASGSVGTSGTKLLGERPNDTFGGAVAVLADLDGDGAADLAVGAPQADDGGSKSGNVYVAYGPITAGGVPTGSVLFGETSSDLAGGALGDAGDLDGDGLSELLLGAEGDDDGGSGAGAVYVISAPVTSGSLVLASLKLTGDAASLAFGAVLPDRPVGDLDGDGYDDLALPAPEDSAVDPDAGSVRIFFGPLAGSASLSTADASVYGAAAGDELGRSVSGGADLDLDGADDLLLGAPGADDNGATSGTVYLVYGPPSGAASVDEAAAAAFFGDSAADRLGDASTFTDDVDGDGLPDFWLLSRRSDVFVTDGGAAWRVAGGP